MATTVAAAAHLKPPKYIIHLLWCELKAELSEARGQRIAATVLAHYDACNGRARMPRMQEVQPCLLTWSQ